MFFLVAFLISVIADADVMKSVLETSRLLTLPYKAEHPSNTEDGHEVGLTSEGLPAGPGVACGGVVLVLLQLLGQEGRTKWWCERGPSKGLSSRWAPC